jgi:hypothetical protein
MGADQLVKLEMERFSVTVLRVLDQKDNQKRDYGSAGVDDELPGVREMEEASRLQPTEPGLPQPA